MNLRRTLAGLIGCLVLGVGLHTAAGSPLLIGASSNGIIYDVDPATGLASNPRDTGVARLSGLAFSPDGVLYGAASGSFFSIDPVTGNATPLGTVSWFGGEFEFDPITSLLFRIGHPGGASGNTLFAVDPESLLVSAIGHSSVSGPLAINASGEFFVLDSVSGELSTIDRNDGAALSAQPVGVDLSVLVGTTFAPDGTLFIVDGGASATDSLHMFDISSGTLTTIGSTGLENGLTSLAYVPEPTTFVLLGMLGVVLAGKARGRVPHPLLPPLPRGE